jgi:O-methyltransferase
MSSSELFEKRIRKAYVKWIRPRIGREIDRQRFKMLYYVWGYAPLLGIPTLSLPKKLSLLGKFLRVDWNVIHGHRPNEITAVTCALASRRAKAGEVMVEAGCWNGGSSAKFSLVCAELGYQLHVYDSFEGVEPMSAEELSQSYDFSHEYAAGEDTVAANITRYGDIGCTSLHKGWFSETLAKQPVDKPVRVAYIDCDIASGTREALTGVVPSLVDDGKIFSQDFHIGPVQKLLQDPTTWDSLGRGQPTIWSRSQLAKIYFA